MPFRERIRRVFHRSSPAVKDLPQTNRNGVKLEYYRHHEIPKSKFRGPFDEQHQKQLAAWSFGAAMTGRRRSMDLSLSPCTSLPEYLRSHRTHHPSSEEDEEVAPDQMPEQVQQGAPAEPDPMDSMLPFLPSLALGLSPVSSILTRSAAPTVTQIEDTQRKTDGGSQSSTMVDPDSFNGSVMTLLPETQREEPISQAKKESVRYTSPVLRTASPPLKSKNYMPFAPEDLTRALDALQIY